MRILNLLIIVISTFSSIALATPPSVRPKSPDERKALAALRFQNNDSSQVMVQKLERNFTRDCDGYSYGPNDKDLMVAPTLETFHPKNISDYLANHAKICPYTAMESLAVIERKSHKRYAHDLAVGYLKSFVEFEKYRWASHMWSLRPILARLGDSCNDSEMAAFKNIYCGYSKQENVDYLFKEFSEKCKGRVVPPLLSPPACI